VGAVTWTLHTGSCLDPVTGLASLPDKSVDHVISDPPYESEAHTLQRRVKREGVAELEPLPFPPMTQEDRDAVSVEMARVARRWVLVFCQVEASQEWRRSLESAGLVYRRTCVWVKPDGQPQLSGDRPGMGYESIVACHVRGKSRWNGGGKTGVFIFNKNDGNGKAHCHPTQKPKPLMRELVELFTDPDDLICDPYTGSGTTGVAARMLGRRFVGWELNPEYAAIARRRIAGERAKLDPNQPELF
jgi:site-specific DNA-methyltransferase (adenine-specific)